MNSRIDPAVWREHGAPLIAATGTGPLTGESVAVKDLYAVAGYAIGAGVREFPAEPESEHAPVVAALLAAGADIAGIAQTDEFAYSITGGNGSFGMPVNPAAPERIPGGSSSGSSVAVARGEASIGLGTDTAGSIRVPAAYQGLWGIRTTHARIDRTGLLPLAPAFDAVGWVARDAAALRAIAEVLLLDPDPAVPRSPSVADSTVAEPFSTTDSAAWRTRLPVDPGPARLHAAVDPGPAKPLATVDSDAARATSTVDSAVVVSHLEADRGSVDLVVDPGVCAVADPAIAEIALAAAALLGADAVNLGADLDVWFAAFRTVQAHEAWRCHGAWITGHPGALEPEVAQRFAYAATITDASARSARALLCDAAASVRAALTGRVLLLPTTATLPPYRTASAAELDTGRARTLTLTCLASLAGLPAVTIPLPHATTPPLAVCMVGAPGTDRALLRFAETSAAVLTGSDQSAERV